MTGKEDQIKTEIAVDGEQEYKKACKEIDASLKAIASEMKVVSATFEGNADSIEAMTAKQDVLNKRLEEQKKKVAEAEAALKKYQDAGQGTSEAAKKMETNLNYARAAMIKTQNEINSLEAGLSEARNASNDFSDGLEDISEEAENTGGALDGLGGKVSSVVGALGTGLKTIGVGVAAIGTAMVAGIGYAVGFADEVKGAVNDFEASTGIAEAAANGFKDAMLSIYKNGFGESLEDISAAMAYIAQTTNEVDPAKLEAMTQNAMMLRDTFGFDIQEQMRAVNMLVDQFGISSREAFNLVAQGAQNGLDKNGDLLDSINEYSVHFKSLGLDAEDMFNSFANGADAGTFSVDKLGDAVKEFGIRVKDESDSTMQAFQSIGLNADETAAAFAAGGEQAAKAFDDVTTAIFAMDDPLAQNTAGVALFGTMWEDLGVEGMQALTNLNGEISTTTDALSQINAIKYEDFGSAISGLGRVLKTNFVLPIGEEALPVLSDFVNELTVGAVAAEGDMSKMSDIFGEALSGMVADFSAFLPQITDFATEIVLGLVDGLVASLPQITTAAVDMITALVQGIVEALPTITEAATDIVLELVDGLLASLPQITTAAVDMITALVQGLVEALPTITETATQILLSLIDGLIVALPMLLEGALQIILALANGIGQALPQLLPKIVQVVVAIVQTLVQNIPMLISAALQLIMGLAQGLIAAIPVLIAAVPTILTSLVDNILACIPQIVQAGIDLLTALVQALPDIISTIVAAIPEIINGIVTALIENIPQIVQAGIDLLVSLIQNLPTIITNIVQAIPQIVGAIGDEFSKNIPQIIEAGVQLFVSLIENLPTIITEIVKAVPQIINGIVSEFGSLAYKIVAIGGDILAGIWQGIQDAAGWLWDQISGFFGGLVGGIKNLLGIHSPSKVFAEIGGYMAEGVGDGFGGKMNSVSSELEYAMGTAGEIAANTATNAVKKGIKANINILIEAASSVMKYILNEITAQATSFYEIGANISDYIAEGIYAGIRKIENNLIELCGEVGTYVIAGIERSLEREIQNISKTVRRAKVSIVPGTKSLSSRMKRNDNAVGGVQVVQNIYANETSYAQQQREAAKQFRLIAREVMG